MRSKRDVLKRVLRESFAAAWQTAWKLRAAVTVGPLVLALVVGWLGSIWLAVIVAVLAFLALIFFFTSFRLAGKVRAEETEPRPYLTFAGADTQPAVTVLFPHPVLGGVSSTATGPVGAIPTPNDFARALVANDPPVGSHGMTAEKVTGKIEFYDENGVLAMTMRGRWAETVQRGQSGHLNISFDTVQLDIVANGLEHPLDVAMKRPGDAHFYAFNDDNSHAPDLCLPSTS